MRLSRQLQGNISARSYPTKATGKGVLLESLFWFGWPGAAILVCVHHLVPRLVDSGVPLLHAWTLSVVGPTVINAVLAAIWYARTEATDWPGFIRRFRFERPSGRTILLVPLVAGAILVLNESLSWTIPMVAGLEWIPVPPLQPLLFEDPYAALASPEGHRFMGVALDQSAWWLIPYWLVFWVTVAVLAEEFVWRGYLLPRQEAVWGRWAWLPNGLLWNLPFHFYTISAIFADMPFFLLLPFVTQRVGNTWFAVMVHSLLVSLALVVIGAGLVKQ